MDILTIAFLSAIGIYILMCKIGLHYFTSHSVITDIAISGLLTILFFGTFTGMATGLTAGIFISFLVWISKLFVRKRV